VQIRDPFARFQDRLADVRLLDLHVIVAGMSEK
jgi:hypothetical protein